MSNAATDPAAAPVRVMVVWCPDWPVQAALQESGLDPGTPIALIDKGFVHACSAAARRDGVRRGLRLREAQARCPALTVLPYNPAQDARGFEPVLLALEASIPTVQVIRPGIVVIRAQGPARFYGGEQQAAAAVLAQLGAVGVATARVGIADGPFTAEQAARRASGRAPERRGPERRACESCACESRACEKRPPETRIAIVPPGDSAAFLAPLPVGLLGMPQLVSLLAKLGVRTLGAFGALDGDRVLARFGPEGAAAHRVASGLDSRAVIARIQPADRSRSIDFEPPLDGVDQIAFSLRQTAEAFIAAITAERLVCTSLEVEVVTESGAQSSRVWLHPRSFTPLDVIDRVRWQLQGSGRTPVVGVGVGVGDGAAAAIARVRLLPVSLDTAANHEEGLWGGGPNERIHHALSRVQSMLGHDAVLTASVGGGRLVADRRVLVPWGERAVPQRAPDRPWPGRLPGFDPTRVFGARVAVQVLDAHGDPVDIDDRDALSGAPHSFVPPVGATADRRPRAVHAWAGPWPIDERWWDAAAARHVHRLQVVTDDDCAWLVLHEHGSWWAEARYD